MKTILITGINGFLGSHLAKALSAEYNIVGLEYSSDNLFRIENLGLKIYSSKEDMEHIFKENAIFAVIHAATIYRRNDTESIESLIKTNIQLPVKLYEFAEKYDCKVFLNTDTFFNNPEYNYSYLPDYTLSKKQVLEWLKLITNKCKLINMKIFHMYGPHDAPNKFIPQIITKLKNNVASIDLTPGEQTRDFIYIDDVVNAYNIVLQNHKLIPEPFKEFQVGTNESTSIKELLIILKKLTKSKTELNFGALQYRNDEITISIANNNELLELGWNPKTDINFGLIELIKIEDQSFR